MMYTLSGHQKLAQFCVRHSLDTVSLHLAQYLLVAIGAKRFNAR